MIKYEKVEWQKRYNELEEDEKANCDFILACLSDTLPQLPQMAKKIKPIVEFCYENNMVRKAGTVRNEVKRHIISKIERTGYSQQSTGFSAIFFNLLAGGIKEKMGEEMASLIQELNLEAELGPQNKQILPQLSKLNEEDTRRLISGFFELTEFREPYIFFMDFVADIGCAALSTPSCKEVIEKISFFLNSALKFPA